MRRMFIAVTVIALTALTACSSTPDHTTAGARPGGSEPAGGGGSSVDRVVVSGTVTQVLADQAFLLTDPTVQQGEATVNGDLPVVVTGRATNLSSDQRVTVTGTFVQDVLAKQLRRLEKQVGLHVNDQILNRVQGGDLLIASSVRAS
jgi:hypothetical protein